MANVLQLHRLIRTRLVLRALLVRLQTGAANNTRVPATGQPLLQLAVGLPLPLLTARSIAAWRIWIQAQ